VRENERSYDFHLVSDHPLGNGRKTAFKQQTRKGKKPLYEPSVVSANPSPGSFFGNAFPDCRDKSSSITPGTLISQHVPLSPDLYL
jgi:hypothetical protein